MSFELRCVLEANQPYYDIDINRNKGSGIAFSKICALLEKNAAHIFPPSFVNDNRFTLLGWPSLSPIPIEEGFEEAILTTAMNVHRIAYRSLINNTVPCEAELDSIQKLFKEISNSLQDAKSNAKKKEYALISSYPCLVLRCSELFVQHIAMELGKFAIFNHSPDKTLATYSHMHAHDLKIAAGMRRWAAIAFQPQFATKRGLKRLESAIPPPECSSNQLNVEETLDHTVWYLASLAYKANQQQLFFTCSISGEDGTPVVYVNKTARGTPSDSEVDSLKKTFQEAFTHFEAIDIAAALYAPKKKAFIAYDTALKACEDHKKKSKERKIKLTKTYRAADEEFKKVVAAVVSGWRTPAIFKMLDSSAKICLNAQQTLEKAVAFDKKRAEYLAKVAAMAKTRYRENSQFALKWTSIREAIAEKISDDTFDMLAVLRDNVPLAIVCMQEYLEFAQARANREPEKSASIWDSFFG